MKAFLAALLVAVRCSGPAPDKLPAIERCRAAWGQMARGASALVVAEACADLYAPGPCRDAWRSLARTPMDDRVPTLVDRCGAVYCPRLPEPKPAACLASAARAEDVWLELDAAILGHELGLPPVLAAQMSLARVVVAAQTAMGAGIDLPRGGPPPARPLVLALRHGRAGGLEVELDGATWTVGAAPQAAELAPLVSALAARPDHATLELILRVDATVPHAAVVTLIEAVKSAGVTRLALQPTR